MARQASQTRASRNGSASTAIVLVLVALVAASLSARAEASIVAGKRGARIATTSATKEQCLSKLLQPPTVTRGPVMLIPQKTEVLITARFNGVEGCDSWERLGQFRVQIKQQGRWLDLNGNFWYPTEGRDVPDKNEAHWFGFLDFATHNVHERCVKGHWEPARWLLRNVVRNAKTGKVAAIGKTANHRVKIKPNPNC